MKIYAILGAAALAVSATAATAATTVSFTGGSGTIDPALTVFQNFDSLTPGSSIGTNAGAYNTNGAWGARPAFGSTGNFAAVQAGGNYTVNFGPTPIFSFVLGSLDTFNTLTLLYSGGGSQVYKGGQIINGLTFDSGNQSSNGSNGVVKFTVTSGAQIVGAIFSSSVNSFEFDNLAAVPEPATWALMILGFGAVGGAMRRRRDSVNVRYA